MPLPAGLMVILLMIGSMARLGGSTIRDGLRESLPKYDPSVRKQALAATDTEAASRPAEAAPAEDGARPAAAASVTPDGAVQLPEVVVEASRTKRKPLPRVHETPPPNRVKIEPFATPQERDAQLVKRHFTPLDRDILNRFALPLIGQSKETRAREAEAIAQNARQINTLADMIAYLERQGASREEIEKLRNLYFELHLARPK